MSDTLPCPPPSRPEPAERAHDLTQHRAILAELLVVERARLEVALRIERERKIVFPETTVIVKDIQRLSLALLSKADDPDDDAGASGEPDPDPSPTPGAEGPDLSFLDTLP